METYSFSNFTWLSLYHLKVCSFFEIFYYTNSQIQFKFYILVFQKAVDTLENLREVKSVLDGSARNFDSPQISEDHLLELKQQVLMHIPSSVNKESQEKFQDLISKTFKGTYI